MQKSSNPVFKNLEKRADASVVQAATLTGISLKTIILLVFAFGSAIASVIFGLRAVTIPGEGVVFQVESWLLAVLGISFFTSFISVMIANFFPRVAMPFSILYAVGQGAFLGVITAIINAFIPGAAVTALIGVGSIFLVMLVLYTSRAFRVTNKFRKVMFASLIGILLASLVSMVLSLFKIVIIQSYPIAIILTILLIIFGAFMLMLDFDYAERITQHGFPKQYEWIAALGLMVTLVWIYVQVLRLIVLVAGRRE
ncbi:MAG: Bax inhibitor-1/YccA family protein [Acholeplasmataceae bacterium]|jgi:uncharacterized YccA/Bax inhibitor family protein|nr:Bax inhibitor-1/YccA family protein [Acholeplasmataceae bacterium]